MSKVISGTAQFKALKKYQLRKGGAKGVRKIRCQVCPELAVAVPDGKGGIHYQCTGCKRIYTFSSM